MNYRLPLSVLSLCALLFAGCARQDAPDRPDKEPAPPEAESSTGQMVDSSDEVQGPGAKQVIAENLDIPWDIVFLPDGDMLVTERPGTVVRIGNGQRYSIQGVLHRGEGGLLGMVLHPEFEQNRQVYLYLTTQTTQGVTNRVERYRFEDDALTGRTEIISGIPGAVYHDGGRMAFGPDGNLYITTGDATNESLAQDTGSLAGKILRIQDDGSIPADNPFGNAVYSYGHRNPQGLAWDGQGRLWSTEHGRSGVASGYDELNLIRAGGNYGWPEIQGSETREGMIPPELHSGPDTTWAPASAAYHEGRIFFGGLWGQALYEAVLSEDGGEPQLRTHVEGEFGRIRTVITGPDGALYLTTSNTDGRGRPLPADDRIIRIEW